MEKHRIELLDSFRFIAVLSVLLYHFTNSWISLYPFGNFFGHTFRFGYLGLNFFFMISGFVISYTLENTPNLFSFYKKRFSRLFPPMLLCTIITFATVSLLDDHDSFRNAHEIKNFVPSLTFINPSLWTLITKIDFHWINGSYWSLWTEIQFYLISSGLYFLNKRYFFRNMLVAGIVIVAIKYIPIDFLNAHSEYLRSHGLLNFFNGWRYGDEIFNITFYMIWFLPGVIFYRLYKGFNIRQDIFSGICVLVILFCLVWDTRVFFADFFYVTMIACLLMFSLFFLMIYQKKYLSFLANPLFTRIGVISYTIYLIHEEIGVLLINKYGKYLGNWSALSPFIIIILVICFAELSFRFYEIKVSMLLRGL